MLTISRFYWVSLQIQNLCDPQRIRHEEDFNEELGRLPEIPCQSYEITYQRIPSSARASQTIAEMDLKWLLCTQRPLKSRELIAAVSVDTVGRHVNIENEDLLDLCCNLAVLDTELDIFRFAHLSVREYLETRAEYGLLAMQPLILERCFDVLTLAQREDPTAGDTTYENSILRPYALHVLAGALSDL